MRRDVERSKTLQARTVDFAQRLTEQKAREMKDGRARLLIWNPAERRHRMYFAPTKERSSYERLEEDLT
jgi:hypothetical protein